MKRLLVISDAHILIQQGKKVAYAPYVVEMDMWMGHVQEVTFISPSKFKGKLLAQPFKRQDFCHKSLRRLEFHTLRSAFLSVFSLPYQALVLWNAMRHADHIHLRAPGNLTLLAGIVAISLSRKRKTVKYAGNFNPTASQPLSYRLQKWLFSNTRLSKNTTVMAYGNWPGMSKNIAPFFTATYSEAAKEIIVKDFKFPLQFMFVGTLSANKNPQVLVDLIKLLNENEIPAQAHFYGDGPMMEELKVQSSEFRVHSAAFQETAFIFYGNQPAAVVKEAYKKSHFLLLASQSEGWPKVVAEAMWHGCIPIATPVSCVPWMLGIPVGSSEFGTRLREQERSFLGTRGLLYSNVSQTLAAITYLIANKEQLQTISQSAQDWSQQYTLERFESEIVKLLNS